MKKVLLLTLSILLVSCSKEIPPYISTSLKKDSIVTIKPPTIINTPTIAQKSSDTLIGKKDKGGIIFYIFKEGDFGYVKNEVHGIVATENNIKAEYWGVTALTALISTSDAIGYGRKNTEDITKVFGSRSITASSVCKDLVLNGYDDWWLPSKEELSKMYGGIGFKTVNGNRVCSNGFVSEEYWSSSCKGTYITTFYFGEPSRVSGINQSRNQKYIFRAIRYF